MKYQNTVYISIKYRNTGVEPNVTVVDKCNNKFMVDTINECNSRKPKQTISSRPIVSR